MPVPTFTVRCTSIRLIAHDVYELRFEKPAGFTYKPGHFILFDVPHPDNPEDIQARAYSIASLPSEDDLLFLIKLVPNGRMSRWIQKRAKATESIGSLVMKGPFGNFLIDPQSELNHLFVCTGSGIAPFRPQILTLLTGKADRRLDLIFGVRDEQDLFWVEDFERLAAEHPNFFLHVVLSGQSPTWTGLRGHVQEITPRIVQDFSHTAVYVCGNPNMTREVKELCLQTWGVSKSNVHVEGYV